MRLMFVFVNSQSEADPGVSRCSCMLQLDYPCILTGLDAFGIDLEPKARMFLMEIQMLSSEDYWTVSDAS